MCIGADMNEKENTSTKISLLMLPLYQNHGLCWASRKLQALGKDYMGFGLFENLELKPSTYTDWLVKFSPGVVGGLETSMSKVLGTLPHVLSPSRTSSL